MMTKEQLLASIGHEIHIIRHLATKVTAGGLDWRPSPAQRSTIELLRYLSTAAIDLTHAMLSGVWDVASVTGKAPTGMRAEEFDRAMEAQQAAIEGALAAITDGDLLGRRATLPTGQTTNLGAALIDVVLKALVAYRMQLFLYAKMSGSSALSTLNCWYGVDAPPSA